MKRILIIRMSAIGDVVMASALIPALRNAWPDAYIAWLAEPAARDLLQHNPRLDELILWPRGEWQQRWRERRYREWWNAVRDFVRELRNRRFDLVLDIQGLLKSGLWARLSGAPERVGLASHEGSQLLMTRTVIPQRNDRRIGSEYLYLARNLGIDPGPFGMDLAIGDADAQAAAARIRDADIRGPYAALCPFTTRPQKHWFADRWASVAGELPRRLGLATVLLGGPGDIEAADRIKAAAGPELLNLAGQTSLGQSAAVIRSAALLIGIDTGLTHMGIALDVPTVALFGSTRPYLDPATERATILYEALPCSPCRRRPTCAGAFTCMRQHTVEGVLQAAERLLVGNR